MTVEKAAFPCYGAIPFRALRDKRLAGIPLIVLGIIAAHDRFGRNGQGCTANQSRIAELVGCRREAVNVAIRLLEQHGYIECERHGDHPEGRRRGYAVVYDNEADNAAFKPAASRSARCAPQRTSSRPSCAPQRTSDEAPACAPQRTYRSHANPPQPIEIAASKPGRQEAEYIPQKGKRYRRSSGSPMCNSWHDPGPIIEAEPDPTAAPDSLQMANRRLLERHGRPDLAAALTMRARAYG